MEDWNYISNEVSFLLYTMSKSDLCNFTDMKNDYSNSLFPPYFLIFVKTFSALVA